MKALRIVGLLGAVLLVAGCAARSAWYVDDAELESVSSEAIVEGCLAGSSGACDELAAALEALEPRTEAQEVALYELYVDSCGRGDVVACERLAGHYVIGERVDRAPERSQQALEAACFEADDEYACYIAGFTLVDGGLGEVDEAGALPLLEAGCALDHPQCCSQVGLMHEFGRGTPLDRAAAFGYFERACELGEARVGCFNVAMHLSEAPDGELDLPRVRELFDRSCRAGTQPACENLEILESW